MTLADDRFISKLLFTPRAHQVIALAQRETRKLGQRQILPEHILLGLAILAQGVAWNIFKRKFSEEAFRRVIEETLASGEPHYNSVPLAVTTKNILLAAKSQAEIMGHQYVGTEHIVLGILACEGNACDILKRMGIELDEMRKLITEELDPTFPKVK